MILFPQVCGVWRNLHPVYVRYLQRTMVYVTLVTPSWPAGEIRGKVHSDRVGGLGRAPVCFLHISDCL